MKKNPEFYSDPPFGYQPSFAQCLTSREVDENGIMADILWMDRRGLIEIEHYSPDGFTVKISKNTEVNNCVEFLTSKMKREMGKKGKVRFRQLKSWAFEYEPMVIAKIGRKFGIRFVDFANSSIGTMAVGLCSVVMMWIFGFFGMLIAILTFATFLTLATISMGHPPGASVSIPWLSPWIAILAIAFGPALVNAYILCFLAWKKINRSEMERHHQIEMIFTRFVKWQQMFIVSSFLPLAAGLIAISINTNLGVAVVIACELACAYFTGKMSIPFFTWLLDNEETRNNRKKWLEFEEFVIKNSDIENRSIKYYELWGEF